MVEPERLLTTRTSDSWLREHKGQLMDLDPRDRVISGQACALDKPDGTPLLRYLPGAIPRSICDQSRAAFRKAGTGVSGNRWGINTQVIGFTSPEPRRCRATKYTGEQWGDWAACLPTIRCLDDVYQRVLPDRYAIQAAALRDVDPVFRIGRTAFTTGTVNRWDDDHDAQTPLHKDKLDLPEGFGVLSFLTRGNYAGGELIFPKWGVAVSMRTGDVLLADVHEWHCNAAIVGQPGWERISIILYVQEKVLGCTKR